MGEGASESNVPLRSKSSDTGEWSLLACRAGEEARDDAVEGLDEEKSGDQDDSDDEAEQDVSVRLPVDAKREAGEVEKGMLAWCRPLLCSCGCIPVGDSAATRTSAMERKEARRQLSRNEACSCSSVDSEAIPISQV